MSKGSSLNLDIQLVEATRGAVSRTADAKRHTVWDVSPFQVTIDTESATAPFEQVRTRIASAVAAGELHPGTKLPTVRQLAADLGVANNTVARAYRELEADGVIATHGRGGTFVRSGLLDDATALSGAADRATAAAADYVHTVRRLGLSLPEAARLVEITWNQG
jgi:DNA-binding transcriptional regulator YhcF (GntR family)